MVSAAGEWLLGLAVPGDGRWGCLGRRPLYWGSLHL